MIKAIIVEDDLKHQNTLKEMLTTTATKVNVVSVCENAERAFADITSMKPDLVFLDIELGAGENGFDLLKKFEVPDFAVIFTTLHNTTTNAISALRACALDFLSKPLFREELETALTRFSVEQTRTLNRNLGSADGKLISIWIKSTEGKTQIDTSNIVHCESDNKYTFFHLQTPVQKKGKYTSSENIKYWENSLTNSNIFRVHNEHLANLKYIDKYTPKGGGADLTMKNGTVIPVSKSRKDEVQKRLNLYRKGHQS